MATTARSGAIVELPVTVTDPALRAVLDRLQDVLGRLTPLLDITLLADQAGYAVPVVASGSTTPIGTTILNTADAGLTQVRLGVGLASAALPDMTIDLWDNTASQVLLTMTVPADASNVVSDWTRLAPWNTDHQLYARVHGDGSSAWTMFRAFLQFRTSTPV